MQGVPFLLLWTMLLAMASGAATESFRDRQSTATEGRDAGIAQGEGA